MKTRFSLLLAALCGLASVASLHAQSSAFTYQGRLTASGRPANGSHDFQFTLFGAPSGGSPVQNPVTLSAVGVTNGVFTVLLDFGASVFAGQDRWLDIAVRPAGGGTFTPLNPRQPITPTPYAVTALNALNVPGVTGHSLSAADGSPANAVFVDNAGNVGVGTTTPTSKLEIASQDALTITGFQPFLTFRDSNAGLARSLFQSVSGGLNLFTEHYLSAADSSAFLRFDNTGNLGLGTATPAAKLEVRGDIRLGPSGQFRATSGEESLRIVRGFIGGGGDILIGSGFQVSHPARGEFNITFNTPFAGRPVITATCVAEVNDALVTVKGVTGVTANFVVRWAENQDYTLDTGFNFIAVGPR